MVGTHGKFLQRILPFVVFGALWYLLIKHLSVYWAVNPQYSFGWFGPVICAYLFFIRWITRPPTGPAPSPGAEWVFWIACFALLPTWLVEQPNPDWRLLSWLLTLEIVILSLCAIYFVGGRSWLRHFAFSICFILTTVPWPSGVEEFITQSLMQVATWVTVESLNLFIFRRCTTETSSRSKRGCWASMKRAAASDPFRRRSWFRFSSANFIERVGSGGSCFLLCGVLIAFFCNVGRTFFLCWVAAKNGIESIPKWHDPAGFIDFVHLFLCALGACSFSFRNISKVASFKGMAPMPFPRRLVIGLGAWLLFTVLGTEVWYRAHETREKLHWSFEWPVAKEDFSDLVIPNMPPIN